jgi:hypothetical protein
MGGYTAKNFPPTYLPICLQLLCYCIAISIVSGSSLIKELDRKARQSEVLELLSILFFKVKDPFLLFTPELLFL